MLDLVTCTDSEIVFRHVYPRSLGQVILWMAVCFAVFDGYLLSFGRADFPLWVAFGLFLPCTIALFAAAIHVIRYRTMLLFDLERHKYHEERDGLGGKRDREGTVDEFRLITPVGGGQVLLSGRQSAPLFLRLTPPASGGSPPCLTVEEFAARIGVPLENRRIGFPG